MRSIELEIDRQVKASAVYGICVDDLVKGILSLKMGKSDGEEGMSSDISYALRRYFTCC